MLRSNAPGTELEKAEAAIETMRAAESLQEFEDAWKEYLLRLERASKKLQAHYKRSPKWNAWCGPFISSKKKDPLLSYLVNTRGAEEHSVEEIVTRTEGSIAFGAGASGSTHIKWLKLDHGKISYEASEPLSIQFRPGRTRLLPIRNRGREYQVPTSHMGRPIDPEDVIKIVMLGLEFHRTSLANAESYFLK